MEYSCCHDKRVKNIFMANRLHEIVYQKDYKYASFPNEGFNPCFYIILRYAVIIIISNAWYKYSRSFENLIQILQVY